MAGDQDKMYTMCLVASKLAGNGVRRQFCDENGIDDMQQVHIKFKGRDQIVDLVKHIMKRDIEKDRDRYDDAADKIVMLSADAIATNDIDKGETFIDGVLKTKDSRICQKRYVDYSMVEMFFAEAYKYDQEHPGSNALENAKEIVKNMYSVGFLENFFFDEKAPTLDEEIRDILRERAFNPDYSLTTEENTKELIDKKYIVDFTKKKEFFTADEETIMGEMRARRLSDEINNKAENDRIAKRRENIAKRSPHPMSSVDLYRKAFVQLPKVKRNRKFINLIRRNSSVLFCSKESLRSRYEYYTLDLKTKHDFIMRSYKMAYENSNKLISEDRFMFTQEATMYRKIWNINDAIKYKNRKLYFPDGAIAEVPQGEPPYKTLHRINAIYAALFGFTPDDLSDPPDWLYNSLRAAYTNEGEAMYVLAMIDARTKGDL